MRAEQIADYPRCGDAVDNIPGITGIGAKSAAVLLAHFDTLDALLERSEEVAFEPGAARPKWRSACANSASTPALAPAHHHRAGRAAAGRRGAIARGDADPAMLDMLVDGVGFGAMTRKRLAEAAKPPS